MRVAHIVTLISADGAYGGPVRVLVEQATELAARGHEVTILAGWDGSARPDVPASVEVNLFRTHSLVRAAKFAGLIAPSLMAYLRKHADSYDVVHVHLARDLVTMPGALLAARRTHLVVQTHGMIQPDSRPKARVLDAVATRRALRRAGAVAYLTPEEQRGLRAVASPIRLKHLPNGISPGAPPEHASDRGPVLFCARLHPRKRVLAFVEMAKILSQRGVDVPFLIAGPDGGELGKLNAALAEVRNLDIRYIGPVPPNEVRTLLGSARVYVLPSVDEPFPMTVLESLASGAPVVLTDTCAIAADLGERGAALVTDGSPRQLADAVELLLSPPRALLARTAGLHVIRESYSIAAVVDSLEAVYADLAGTAAGRPPRNRIVTSPP